MREPKERFRLLVREVYFVAMHLLRLPFHLLRNCKVALSTWVETAAVRDSRERLVRDLDVETQAAFLDFARHEKMLGLLDRL